MEDQLVMILYHLMTLYHLMIPYHSINVALSFLVYHMLQMDNAYCAPQQVHTIHFSTYVCMYVCRFVYMHVCTYVGYNVSAMHFISDCSIEVVKDIVFLIDTTRSIGNFCFQNIREFVANLTTDLKLISPESKVGVILFDWLTHLQFNLQRHTSLSTLAINPGLPYINSYYSTNTANAFEFLLSSAQNGMLGIRNETSNIAIVITDGRSSNQFLTQSAAAALHAANMFDIYAIGFGSADINELRTIASDPRFVYFTNLYSEFALQVLKMNIIDQLCSGKNTAPIISVSVTIQTLYVFFCSSFSWNFIATQWFFLWNYWTNARSYLFSHNNICY